ncbi:MAG: hypothetical protein LBL96_00405 [Clostridiales bacterium]|nr:hypothetical protein [Clostridiales bacterium]
MEQDLGTIGGKPITQEMLDSFTATFERDWEPSEVKVIPTERGKALRALHDLNIPPYEIEALERRAKNAQQPLSIYIHTILRNDLLAVSGNTRGDVLQ